MQWCPLNRSRESATALPVEWGFHRARSKLASDSDYMHTKDRYVRGGGRNGLARESSTVPKVG